MCVSVRECTVLWMFGDTEMYMGAENSTSCLHEIYKEKQGSLGRW